MSFRNTWNRMLRRTSTMSTSSSSSDQASTAASSAPSSPGWGPSATFSWLVPGGSKGSNASQQQHHQQPSKTPPHGGDKKKSKKTSSSSPDYKKRLHPSERPLTKENLRHQEMFANFSFGEPGSGSSRSCSTRHSFESGVSPCGSRRASFVDV